MMLQKTENAKEGEMGVWAALSFLMIRMSFLMAKSIDTKEDISFIKCPSSGFKWWRKKSPVLRYQSRPCLWDLFLVFSDAMCDTEKVSYDQIY